MNTQQTLFIHILFVFMGHNHLYFSFNTLLMPQWIKIQPLFKINNTQNIQRILECFTARVLTTLAVHEQMYRPVTNDPEGTEVAFQSHTQMLPCLLDFFLCQGGHQEKARSSDIIRMHPRLNCCMLRCSITPHQQRAEH